MIRLSLSAAALAALLAGPAGAVPPECPAITFPAQAADCDARIWGAWDGSKIVSRWQTLRSLSPTCTPPAMSPGWALIRTIQAPYPQGVIQALYRVSETPPQVHIDTADQSGCELRGYAVAWHDEVDIAAAIETYGHRAQAACAAEIAVGAIGPGRTDYRDVCAYSAGVRERIEGGETITDPGERDPATWCRTWQRDCAAPAIAEVGRLIGLALAARTRAGTCDAGQTDPEAADYCLPAPDLCGDGWTHDPCAAPAEEE